MNKYSINALALAVGLAFSAGAMAQSMAKDDYKAGKTQIASQYKAEKAACGSFSGNARDICVAEAKGREKVARADLEASYKPSVGSRYKSRVVAAEASYAVAKERCDDKGGTAKDVCVEEAKAVRTTAKADAKAQMKVSDANAEARGKATQAREAAAASANDAQYGVAKEKCDAYASEAKEHCLAQAKKNFGKT
ncbi:MAG: hypothetical protein NDI91_15435 [Sulfuritalea sp.]|nr:hypothetical protein [Sulfuritalea sp.]